MYENHSIAVVVPAYNEETQIGKVIETMPELVDKIIIVDDLSGDKTSETVQSYIGKEDRIILILHEVNQGVGGAIATGYKWARDNDMDIAVVMAGDGQMDPDDLPALLDPVVHDGVDYTKGNRLVTGEAFKVIPKVRYFGNSMLSLLTKIASGYWHVADSQTGYTAINKEALHKINWDEMFKRYGQPNDLLVKLNVLNFRVRDVPIRPVYNIGEKSGLKPLRAIYSIGSLVFRLWLWRLKEKYIIRDFHPLIFFYFMGVMLLLFGSILSVRMVYYWIGTGEIPELNALTSMFAFTLGFQSVFFAMWFDMEANKHLR